MFLEGRLTTGLLFTIMITQVKTYNYKGVSDGPHEILSYCSILPDNNYLMAYAKACNTLFNTKVSAKKTLSIPFSGLKYSVDEFENSDYRIYVGMNMILTGGTYDIIYEQVLNNNPLTNGFLKEVNRLWDDVDMVRPLFRYYSKDFEKNRKNIKKDSELVCYRIYQNSAYIGCMNPNYTTYTMLTLFFDLFINNIKLGHDNHMDLLNTVLGYIEAMYGKDVIDVDWDIKDGFTWKFRGTSLDNIHDNEIFIFLDLAMRVALLGKVEGTIFIEDTCMEFIDKLRTIFPTLQIIATLL